MAENSSEQSGRTRNLIAYITLGFSAGAITLLAAIIIFRGETDDAMTIFNIVLPVFASWVGTILAFYYGRENFESANKERRESFEAATQEIRKMVDKVSPEERAKELVTAAMRGLGNTVHFQITEEKSEQDVNLAEICDLFTENITRIPIIDAGRKPIYMIHQSSIDSYVAAGRGEYEDTLETFITTQEDAGIEFGLDKGFVVVSEGSTIAEAKSKMEEKRPSQDVFVTQSGSPDEPLSGWLSNVRMSRYLEAK
jgi:CBS domain-containing protein